MKRREREVTCSALFPRQPYCSIIHPNVRVVIVRKVQINPRIKPGHSFHLLLWIWPECSALPFCVVNWLHRKCCSVHRLLGNQECVPLPGRIGCSLCCHEKVCYSSSSVIPIHSVTLCCIAHGLLMGLNKNPSIANQTRFIPGRRNTFLFIAFFF